MGRILALVSLALLCACVARRLEVTSLDVTSQTPITVTTPVKAHLLDGATVVFPNGISVANQMVRGDGQRYDLTLANSTGISEIPVSQIAAMESYQTPVNAAGTVGRSAGMLYGGIALGLLLFGSCPTVYSMDAAGPRLEAELFSYSIAPTFQSRDVDRLGTGSITGGPLRLELRNEMLETHYIDQLEVLEVLHAPDHEAYPDEKGRPLVVGPLIQPVAAVDQSGRDIRDVVAGADALTWSTPKERLDRVSEQDLLDHLDLEFDVPREARDVAIVLRMRNSLLSTVLLYDVMLKGQSFGALDWMGQDLSHLGSRLKLALWYREHMGMNISVWDHGAYRVVKHVGDQGPIAWSERAVQVPAGDTGRLKVRLSFIADNWNIDRIGVALDSKPGKARTIGVARATTPEGDRSDIPAFLAQADKQYLITQPQDSVALAFDVGDAPAGQARSFFVASEGYYIEWMRADWLTEERRERFAPGDDALLQALAIHASTRDAFREQFDATKIPVR